jgi:hypothetical protein
MAPQGGPGRGQRDVASQGLLRYLDASARGPLAAVPAGEWCNGNTAVFGTVILGSSPSSPANSSGDKEAWTPSQLIGRPG